nr:phage portal protein [uncultured Cohaesibacter sp.]
MLRWTLKGPARTRSPRKNSLRDASSGKGRENAGSLASQNTEEKSSRTGALIAVHQTGRPRWTPRDYAALAIQGYARNPIVYRSIRMISEAAASARIFCQIEGERLTEHPVLNLLRQPNERQDGATWLESLYGHLLVSGNAYIEGVCGASSLKELHCLRPDRIKVVPGLNGWPDAYDYTIGNKSVRFDQTDDAAPMPPILHITLFHPHDDHYGLSPLEAAQISLDVHNAAASWNKALLDNSARPSGALVYAASEAGNLSDEQFERLKKELEEGYQGAMNAGRPLLLEGGLDWKSMSMSPRDMDFIDAKNSAAREIALAFGVPPMLLGIPGDNTYANYAEANRAFWRQTVLPLAGRCLQSLARWLSPAYDEPFELKIDLDLISALASEREALWNRVGNASFLSENEKRIAVGYSPIAETSGSDSGVSDGRK